MNWQVILSSMATSAVVAGLLTFILKTYFKTRIEHVYKIELEKCKAELALHMEQGQAFISRRLEGYPALVALVYRTRNMARDLTRSISPRNVSLAAELAVRTEELEELLYKYRIDLERDGCFQDVHRYKNVLLNFNMLADDIKYFLDHGEEERAERCLVELAEIHAQVETIHLQVIQVLSLGDSQGTGVGADPTAAAIV